MPNPPPPPQPTVRRTSQTNIGPPEYLKSQKDIFKWKKRTNENGTHWDEIKDQMNDVAL